MLENTMHLLGLLEGSRLKKVVACVYVSLLMFVAPWRTQWNEEGMFTVLIYNRHMCTSCSGVLFDWSFWIPDTSFFPHTDVLENLPQRKEQIAIVLLLPPSTFFDLFPPPLFRPQEDSAAGQAFEGQGSGGAGLLQSGQHLHATSGLWESYWLSPQTSGHCSGP